MKTYYADGSYQQGFPVGIESQGVRYRLSIHGNDAHGWGPDHGLSLARDLLWDHAGKEPDKVTVEAFANEVLGKFPTDIGFRLPEEQVRYWVRHQKNGVNKP